MTVLFSIPIIYLLHSGLNKLRKRRPTLPPAGPYFGAVLEIVLLGYSAVTGTTVRLLHCVSIQEKSRWYYDAQYFCWHQWWQQAAFVVIALNLFPFILTLYFTSLQLYRGKISGKIFLLASILPFPYLLFVLYHHVKKKKNQETGLSSNPFNCKLRSWRGTWLKLFHKHQTFTTWGSMRSIYKATRWPIRRKDLLGEHSHWSSIPPNCDWLVAVGPCAYAFCVSDNPLPLLFVASHIPEALRPPLGQLHRNRLLGSLGRYRSNKRGPCIGRKWRQRYQSTVFPHSFDVRGSITECYTSCFRYFPHLVPSFANCTGGDLLMESCSSKMVKKKVWHTVVRPGWRRELAFFYVIVIELYASYFQVLSNI